MDHKTSFNPTSEKTYYKLSENNMFIGTPHAWQAQDNPNGGDNLWRTGWAYIVYKSEILKEGILSCFTDEVDKKGRKYIQAHRSPGKGAHNVSRDQLVSALSALYLNGDHDDLRRIIKGLRWRISDKFRLTLTIYSWMKAISSKTKSKQYFWSLIFCILSLIITLPIKNWWNDFLFKDVSKINEISQEQYQENIDYVRNHLDVEFTNIDIDFYINFAMRFHSKGFGLYLFAWQLYTLPKNPCWLKTLLKKMGLKGVHPSNYFMRMIFGQKVTQKEIDEFSPMSGIRWQEKFFQKGENYFYNACVIIEKNHYFNNQLELENTYNVLDNDMLWYLVENHPELVIKY